MMRGAIQAFADAQHPARQFLGLASMTQDFLNPRKVIVQVRKIRDLGAGLRRLNVVFPAQDPFGITKLALPIMSCGQIGERGIRSG